ncbi:MAG TPA: D-aminoacyl-tRNA deacylase, partial [Flavobacteriaceae bacterium]
MKAVIQRVSKANVVIEGEQVASIGNGVLVLLGIVDEDTKADISWLS